MLYQTILPNLISDYNFVLYHAGDHSHSPSFNMVSIVEHNLSLFLPKSLVKKFSYIVIEAVQNIERYSDHNYSQEDFSLIFCDDNTFHVITRNLVENGKVSALEERLDTINSKHSEELNQFYIECSRSDEFSSKGAGLGLIDIARKSKNPLDYTFTKKNEAYSSYMLHIKIPIREEINEEMAEQSPVVLTRTLFSAFGNNNSTLFYSGDFSNSFLHALLDMLKVAKKNEKMSADTKVHHMLIELTQNIKRHGHSISNNIPGYLCIEWGKENIGLSSYNLINSEKKAEINKKIELLNASSEEELKTLSHKHLNDFSSSGGLGLIDIALLSRPNKITYNLAKDPRLDSYLYLKTNINHE
jgi:hypothetical protein